MPFTRHAIYGDASAWHDAPLVGLSGRIEHNLGSQSIADEKGRLGSTPLSFSGGAFSVDMPATDDAAVVAQVTGTLQYRVLLSFTDPGGGGRRTWDSGWFSLTADVNVFTVDGAVSAATAQTGAAFLAAINDAGAEQVAAVEAAGSDYLAQGQALVAQQQTLADIDTPDELVATLVPTTSGSATSAALSETFAGQADSKKDGQNVRNLRRPTLVVDRMFPNANHDHQVLWVDETARIAYAIGQDRRLRKSTWTATTGNPAIAMSFGLRLSSAPAGKTWAGDGIFFRLPNGHLFLEERDTGHGLKTNTKLLRSTNDGSTFATVWTAPAGVHLLGSQSIARDEVTGYLYLVEYMPSGSVLTTADIWRSTDNGATWAVWYSHPRTETNDPGFIRHWHGTRYDPVSQRVYFSAGDTGPDAGIYRVSADGTTAEAVVTNADLPQFTTAARTIDFMFFPDYIAWALDGEDAHVYRMARTEIGKASPVVEQVAALNSTAWWSQKASDDGSVWVVSASNEATADRIDAGVHLYAVSDNGAQVDEVGAFNMPGDGSTSIAGLALGSGGGANFWMHGHNYLTPPLTTYTGFTMRARIAWGAVPIRIPEPQRRYYTRQGRNWVTDLTAGQTVVFGRTRVPFVATRISLFDIGVAETTGSARIEVYNVSTSTVLYSTTVTDWRYESMQDTTEVLLDQVLAAGNVIEFRVVETTGTTPASGVMAHVEFGFSML